MLSNGSSMIGSKLASLRLLFNLFKIATNKSSTNDDGTALFREPLYLLDLSARASEGAVQVG